MQVGCMYAGDGECKLELVGEEGDNLVSRRGLEAYDAKCRGLAGLVVGLLDAVGVLGGSS